MSDLFPRPLKEAGSKAIEDAITKAIRELAGENYEADIASIDFEPFTSAYMHDAIEIKVKISRKGDLFGDSE